MTHSYLYVPADKPDKLAGAASRGADALIVDLEDAVPAAAKADARQAAAEFVAQPSPAALWVRVNSGAALSDDVRAVVTAELAGIVVAKCESAGDVAHVDRLLAAAELNAGLPIGQVAVAPLIESAAGVLDAARIAQGPRVARLQIGEADLAADLGVELSQDGCELLAIRTQLVVCSAAAGIDAPVGPVSTDYRDLAALEASTTALRRLGFGGRAAIHPAQIAVINRAFEPSSEELESARRLVDSYEAARTAGQAVLVDDQGRMVDEAVIRSARRTLGDR